MASIPPKKNFHPKPNRHIHRRHNRQIKKSWRNRLITGTSTTVDELHSKHRQALQLRNLHSFLHCESKCTCQRNNGHCHLVQELHLSSQQRACQPCSRTALPCTCRRNNGHVNHVRELHPMHLSSQQRACPFCPITVADP